MDIRYHKELAKRFVNDYKLPIVMIGERYFGYFLNLYEDEYHSLTQWLKLWDEIDDHFDGNADDFLLNYYEVREKIISTVESSDVFQSFNNMDMDCYKVVEKPNVSAKDVYNCENIGIPLLSIDLKKANFQALNYVNRNILMNSDTYEDFVSKFTESEYIKNSKYFRSVVFGKMNPSRHITVEKYLINEVWKLYNEMFPNDGCIISMQSDEIVIKGFNDNDFTDKVEKIEKTVKERLGLNVRAEFFELSALNLESKDTKDKRSRFFIKKNIITGNEKFVCVPACYFAITYKLYKGLDLEEPDYHFQYEGIDCRFMEEFELTNYIR